MGLRINNNIDAFNAHRNLKSNASRLAKSMEKLSSGFRINRAADDAAGLGISERMRGQIRGLEQAQRNAHDGISLVQTAEGAMTELHSILHRVRELAVQYSNGTNGPEAQMAITTEVEQLADELDRMINGAEFNGVNLLDGSTASLNLQVGPNQGGTNVVAVNFTDVGGITAAGGDIATVLGNFVSGGVGATTLADIDDFVNQISTARGAMGAVQNRLEYTVNSLGIAQENLMAAESRIRDVDMAQEMANFSRLQILQESGVAMLAQANMTQSAVLKLLG